MTRRYVGIEDGIPTWVEEGPRTPVKFDAVLVRPLDAQLDCDGPKIDPSGVEFDPERDYLIHWEFRYGELPLGHGRVSRADDGSLLVHGELFDTLFWGQDIQPKLAVGVVTDDRAEKGSVIEKSRLLYMALCREHADPEQPPIVIHAKIKERP